MENLNPVQLAISASTLGLIVTPLIGRFLTLVPPFKERILTSRREDTIKIVLANEVLGSSHVIYIDKINRLKNRILRAKIHKFFSNIVFGSLK